MVSSRTNQKGVHSSWRHVWLQLFCILPITAVAATGRSHPEEAVVTADGNVQLSGTGDSSIATGTTNTIEQPTNDRTDPISTTTTTTTTSSSMTGTTATYGVDTSWPMHHHHHHHHHHRSANERMIIPSKYDQYMSGCKVQSFDCDSYESDRIEMNFLQPSAMYNYTHSGYAKVFAPPQVMNLLTEFWNRNVGKETAEVWDSGNTYVNHWESPTYMLDLGRPDFYNPHPTTTKTKTKEKTTTTSKQLREEIVQQVQAVLEAWTQHSLVVTSLYGIRIYRNGAILAPHVDRLPLVSSAIINVAQNVQEPWVLEVINHDGIAVNLTMEPGEMILYESHSIIHGRPFPLKGQFYANVFVHFEPIGHTLRHAQRNQKGSSDTEIKNAFQQAMAQQFESSKSKQRSSSSNLLSRIRASNVPRYIHPDNAVKWRQDFEFEKENRVAPKPTKTILGLISVHHAAADGDMASLLEIAQKDRSQLFKADRNGWRPLHEAARSGRHKIIAYLIKEGAQINERTNNGKGGNALWWAKQNANENKKAIELLEKHGAVSLGPIKDGD